MSKMTDGKAILSLINRIGTKLPCNSGKSLDALEQDPLIQQNVNSLVELSRYKLPIVAEQLSRLLDNISKPSSMVLEEFVPMDILQSQLFLLKILSASMTHHWKCYRNAQKEVNKLNEQQLADTANTASNGQYKLPRSWDDPPPLDDALAKLILGVLVRFLHQMASQEENVVAGGSPPAAGAPNNQVQTYEIICEIFKNAGRVIFYLSASNWGVIFARVKQRILHLTTTNDEWPETAELKLLEVSDLNSTRLSQVLQELCNSFIHLKQSAQTVMAFVLRKAIWNWIEVFPAEFVTLCQSRGRMGGGPELLFDTCCGLAETARRRTVIWPLQTMLLILCPDILAEATSMSDAGGAGNRKQAYLDSLRRALRGARVADIAAVCYVDICKAATYVSQNENLALRQMVPEIENELRDKLFDPKRPFMTEQQIDQRLMTDCLTALFRLNPTKTLNTIIPICLRPTAPPAFRLVLVKSCFAIASEENRLPWNPAITAMYSIIASPLRKLFQEYIIQRDRNLGNRRLRPEEQREANEKKEIILNILKLYRTDPMLAIFSGESGEQPEENRAIIYGISLCFNDTSPGIRMTAAETLLALHSPDYIEKWGPPENRMQNFWNISSQVMLGVARQLLEPKEEGTKYMLELLLQLLTRRNDFLKMHKQEATIGINVPERIASNVAIEIALLVLLCSADTEICSMAVACFGHLCTEAQLTEDLDSPQQITQLTIIKNIKVYMELSSSPFVLTGRMAQQKRIRRLLRIMTNHTAGNLAAWEEAYKRWRNLTLLVARPAEEPAPHEAERRRIIGVPLGRQAAAPVRDITEAETTEWHNYTGFLSALGGVCVFASQSNGRNGFIAQQSVESNYQALAEKFLSEMVDLLVCDSVYVREIVKETLGADLSPRLYTILFQYLENIVKKFFDSNNGQALCTDRHTLFVEQAISVLKLILDRVPEVSENLYAVDFGGLILSFATYLHRLANGHVALRIKVKMCQLTEALMAKKDYVTLRQEISMRNRLLEVITEWTSDYNARGDSGDNALNANERLQRDLDQACLKTIVALLAQLPLQPPDGTREADLSKGKASLFFRYFTFFIKLLNRCRVLEAIDSGTHSARNNPDLQMLLTRSREYVKDLGPLKDYTILALSNLLSANVESGLQYSLQMGYHDDAKTRSAFMEVLTNILNQGAEFEGLAENAINDRYNKLVELLTDDDLSIAMSFGSVPTASETDDVALLLLTVFESRGKSMPLLKASLEREVYNTENEFELFRRNSLFTRLLNALAKTHGSDYLKDTIQPVLYSMYELSNDVYFELDPDRAQTTSGDINQNVLNTKQMAQSFLDAICSSVDKAPLSFREVCYYIANTVKERFPESRLTAVGGFIFLRFFCPVLVFPENGGLMPPPSQNIRRGLLGITKIIQNLANNVLFGAKEPYMVSLNEFLSSNIEQITKFLINMSSLPADFYERKPKETIAPLEDADRKLLHKHLCESLERVGRDLVTRRNRYNPKGLSELEQIQAHRKSFNKLSTLLALLGPAPETPRRENAHVNAHRFAANNKLYTEFMQRNAHRDIEAISRKALFYEGGRSRERRPVFYFIARRLQADIIDIELLMYYIFHVMEASMNKPFEVLVDLTQFSPANEVQIQWMQTFSQTLPYEATEKMTVLYLYNVNTAFKKFSKKLHRLLSSKIARKTVCLNNLSELHEYIAHGDVRLPKSTIALDSEQSVTYMPVTKNSPYRTQTPVIMRINSETVQVITTRKQDLFYGLNCNLNDVYHISDIDEMSLTSHKGDDNEFVIKHDRGQSSFTFVSPKRDFILQAIREAKARFNMARPSTSSDRAIRPSDVPGKLLNMALLNMGSDDHCLRLAAYNLLVALCLTFNFDVGNQLLSTKGLCIPANNTTFVVSLSERLAASEPHLTLEFLTEFFDGFRKSSTQLKHLCLQYMAPWLKNLEIYNRNSADNQQHLQRTREILRSLIELTTKETNMYTTIQMQVWATLGKVDGITSLIIDEFVHYAVEHGISSPQAETVANTIVTLSSTNVRGKIIARLRKIISKPSPTKSRSIVDNPLWTEIAVLVRFNLMLSFNNRAHVAIYLPELFYIVSLLVATGPHLIRASIHGLVVNLIQSLCTQNQIEPDRLSKLTIRLTEFSEPKSLLLFGLNSVSGSAFAVSGEAATSDVSEIMPLSSLESIVHSLLEVMVWGASSVDVSNTWRARWVGLVASTAFQVNPAIQPRAFVTLGCLAREEVDDDLLYQILVALRGALSVFSENDCSLIISIIMCLTNIVENLPRESRYFRPMFWLAMALVQIGHIPVFPSAIRFLQVLLRAMDTKGFFAEEDIAKVLLRERIPLADVATEMDAEAGINYDHFSFAVAATLLKGLKHPGTRADTQAVLMSFLEIASKGVNGNGETHSIHCSMLGYLAALLPVSAKNAEMKELLWVCGMFDLEIDNAELATNYYKIFDKLEIPDNQTALLLVSLMVAILQSAESEPERLFLYGFLAEAANSIPQVFTLVYDSLLPKMNQIMSTCDTIPILDAVHNILYTVVASPAITRSQNNHMPFLEEIGFTHLMDCGLFAAVTKEKMRQSAKLAALLVDRIIA